MNQMCRKIKWIYFGEYDRRKDSKNDVRIISGQERQGKKICFLEVSNQMWVRFQPVHKYCDKQESKIWVLRSALLDLKWEGDFESVQLKGIFTLIIHSASGLSLSAMQSYSHWKASQCASTKISEYIAQNVLNIVWYKLMKSHSTLKD